MGKIIITEQQFKLLLGEERLYEQIPYGDEIKGQSLYHIGSIPTDKQETPGAIQNILSSVLEKGDSFPLGNIDLTDLDIRNKMRFAGYLDAFHQASQYGRGDMWEGLFAGLYGGNLTLSDDSEFLAPKADVLLNGGRYSLKFLNSDRENPVLGNMALARDAALGELPSEELEYGTEEPLYLIFRNPDSDLYNFKESTLSVGFEDVDYWVFAYPDTDKQNIIFKLIGNDDLINLILLAAERSPTLISRPKNNIKNQLRISYKILQTIPTEFVVKFPTVSAGEYQEYERLTPTETKAGELFGKRHDRVDPDILQYIRKNPRPFIKRLHKMYGDRFDLGLTF